MASNTITRQARGQGNARPSMQVRLTPIAAAVALALGAPATGSANPQGGVVQAGQASIKQTTPNRIDIIQSTPRAAINWQSFSIGSGEHVNFAQPSAQAATLNRVIGVDPSVILGRITANGQVFLVNPNGMLFAPGSKIDVGALIASTANISNSNFMAGQLKFDEVSNRRATIVNRGEITAARGGLVALVAPGVENAGVIRAQLGRVALASGNAFTLDLYGDKLVRLVVDDAAMDRLTDVEGRTLRSLVGNSGRIEADGGSVLLAAAAAKGVLDAAINMSGTIEARSFEQRAGTIVLHGGEHGAVQVAGRLDASAPADGGHGGSVAVLGKSIEIASAAGIDVSGHSAGGTALVGGDWQGGGSAQRASTTTVQSGSSITADALARGNGGKVVVWSDGDTKFAGTITARGGPQGGDGGNVEVSGKRSLEYLGSTTASAARGRAGNLLLDPVDWIINATDADALSLALRGGTNVALQADNLIQVNESIDGRGGTAGASLSLDAGNRIALNNDLLTNNGAVTLRAGAGGLQMGTGSRTTSNNGAVVSAGNQTIGIQATGTVDAQHLITTGAVNITTTGAASNVALRRDLNGLAGAPLGALTINAGGAIEAGGLNANNAAALTAGGAITLTPSATASFAAGSVNATAAGDITISRDVLAKGGGAVTLASTGGAITMGTRSVASQSGGAVSLTSAGALTVADVFTSGTVRLESTSGTVDLTRDLLGAAGSNGVGAVTIRSGSALTIDNAIKSIGGIDIGAGGTTPAASRDLTIALGGTGRLEANVANAGVKQDVVLSGAKVDLNAGEIHTNGGALTIDARNGRTFMGFGAGLFAGTGNITIQSTDRVDLTRVSLAGNLAVTSTNGAIRLDGDLGSNLGAGTPQPVGSVTLSAGGSYSQSRTYFTNYNFALAPGAQTPPSTTVSSAVGVRVRAIRSNGPVTITASQPGAEILTDGIIDAQSHVTLNASTVRLRHSVFATGGNITIGGPLVVEPWGDEIGFECAIACSPGAADPNSLLVTTDTYALGGVTDSRAPGSTVTLRPSFVEPTAAPPGSTSIYGNVDLAASQVTLRATSSAGVGGGITLNGSAGRELDIRSDQQFVRFDRAAHEAGIPEPIAAVGPYDRSGLALVPMNNVRLNLQSSNGVTFRAGTGGSFAFTGTQQAQRLPNSTTNHINEPYFRVVIASPTGTLNNAAQTVVNASGVVVPSGFSSTLHSLNGAPPGGGGAPGGLEPAVSLPGANFILSYVNPSGLESPPGPTSVTPGLFSAGELTPGSTAGSGSGSPGTAGGGITLADARPIAPAPPPPSAPGPAPAPAPAPTPSPSPAPAPTPAPAPATATAATGSTAAEEVLVATKPPAQESEETLVDAGADVFKVADLGRSSVLRGSATDVFRARSNPANLATPGSSEADSDYFLLSLWDYLTRLRTRGRR